MKILGNHLVVELTGCNNDILNDCNRLQDCFDEAVRKSVATKVKSVFHRYNPHGVSGVVVIAESHMSIHTWPEYGYAAVDFFTCGDTVDPYKAFQWVKTILGASSAQISEIKRGMPSSKDEVIDHKPFNQTILATTPTN